MPSERTVGRLRDIVDDARRIADFVDGMSASDFATDEKTVFAVERLLQRITEAAIQIDPNDMASIASSLPIAQMRALGNRLRHEYRDIDRAIIFDLARTEVPALAVEVERILADVADG